MGPTAIYCRIATCFLLAASQAAAFSAVRDTIQTYDRWTPELIIQYRLISATSLSADGSRVAYVVRSAEIEAERSEFVSQIWVASADGSKNVQYTRGKKSATHPAFSPDGTYLAFLSSRGQKQGQDESRKEPEKSQIWLMRVEGGEAERLTTAQGGITAFKWSPDGSRIAYLMPDPKSEEEEKAIKEKRRVTLVHQDFKYAHLYTMEVGGEGKTKRLTEGTFHVTGLDWSPDGESLVFSYQPDPRINTGGGHGDLARVPAAGGETTPLVTRPGVDSNPSYSPDGKWIAFTSNGGQEERVGLEDVFILSAVAQDSPQPLAKTPDRRASLLGWSADGEAVYVSEVRGTTRQVLALPTDGRPPSRLAPVDGVLAAVSLSRDGSSLAFAYEGSEEPPEVYVSPTSRFEKRRLSVLNSDRPRPPMGRTELVSWTSSDGLEIEGLLTYPVDYQEGRACPLILSIHGGPAGVYTQSFTGGPGIYQYQYFAQNGYAILRPNPRGSTGYGKEFRYANVRDWGWGDYEDLMSGVDKVIDMGVADPQQLFVMGWSYGGYMTSYLVTRTERFRAASMGAGLSNLASMVHTTDIPDYLAVHMGGELWQNYATYEKHSAIYRIENVKTPTQILHGAEDRRVPLSQGQEFFVALERLGVPTEMVVYPRTPHGPREPKLLMDVSERILQWFEKFRRQKDRGGQEAGVSGSGG